MVKHILVSTDFSNDAYNALHYATQLFKGQKCTFHILHAYDGQSPFKEDYKGRRNQKKLIEFIGVRTGECLLETYHRIISDTEKNPLHTFITIPRHGALVKCVKDYMLQTPIDLLIMGNKGRTGAKEIFLGGNTIHMVKSGIPCPTLCIPKEIEYKPIKQMVYITNYEDALGVDNLNIVKSLALSNEAPLHILHISQEKVLNAEQERNKEFINNFFEDVCVRFHTVPNTKTKAETVGNFVRDNEIDLLALAFHRHYFLDKLFREPVILDVSFYLEIPFIVVPDLD